MQEGAEYKRCFNVYLAAVYKCVSKVSPSQCNNIYLTSNVFWEVESQGKREAGRRGDKELKNRTASLPEDKRT